MRSAIPIAFEKFTRVLLICMWLNNSKLPSSLRSAICRVFSCNNASGLLTCFLIFSRSLSEIYLFKFSVASNPRKLYPKLKHHAICRYEISLICCSLSFKTNDCNCNTNVRLSLTIIPQTFRASHQRSYDWLILNERIIDIAVPIKWV